MSHLRLKTKYKTEGAYGSEEEYTLYAHHNNSCDYVTFYDDDGSCIFSYPDTQNGNMFQAMQRLASPYKDVTFSSFKEGVEYASSDDFKKIDEPKGKNEFGRIIFTNPDGTEAIPDKKIVLAYVVSADCEVLQIIRGDSEIIVERNNEGITWQLID